MTPFQQRRAQVLERLEGALLLLPAAQVFLRNGDVEHEYRQHSDFMYLTGFEEPECMLALGAGEHPATLFLRERNPEREQWDGARLGVEAAPAALALDRALPISQFEAVLPSLLEGHARLVYRLGENEALDRQVIAAISGLRRRSRTGAEWPVEIVDPAPLLHEMRLIKDEFELEQMGHAAQITAAGYAALFAAVRPGLMEYELEAVLRGEFRRGGSPREAYSTIVGSGPNATVLHYVRNDRRVQEGDLVLVDAGCEFGGYASDVTRTFPANGRFSPAQRALYELVLAAQLAAIDAVRPGATLEEVHFAALVVLVDGLIELGLCKGSRDEVIATGTYRPYYMHRTSHWLGMDVHDVGRYFVDGRHRALAPGMVLTVEPGLYVSPTADCDERYRGIGIRIEDNVVVAAEGPARVLTTAIPKSIAELEAACSRR